MKAKVNTVAVVVGVFILLLLSMSWKIIRQGEVGVVTRFGKTTGRIMQPGLNWKIPLAEAAVIMDTKIRRADTRAQAGTRDLQTVDTSIVLNYHIMSSDTSEIYGNIGDDNKLYEKVIYPAIQEVVKSAFSQYKAEELLTKRDEVKEVIDTRLSERLSTYWVKVDDISLTDITFSKEFDKAIEAKQVAEQMAQKAQYEVVTAKAEAEKNKVQTTALTPEILQKMWLEKWNGVLPQVLGDGVNVMYGFPNK